ncbi:hypothetical protein HYW53_00290 [Candidatus Giovannonibacteria bacterium]|nr:hypothetical protein [Candidatus Giovannonibacteria bacterium]
MNYLAILDIENKNRSIVECIEQESDDLAKADLAEFIKNIEAGGDRVIGRNLYEVSRFIPV